MTPNSFTRFVNRVVVAGLSLITCRSKESVNFWSKKRKTIGYSPFYIQSSKALSAANGDGRENSNPQPRRTLGKYRQSKLQQQCEQMFIKGYNVELGYQQKPTPFKLFSTKPNSYNFYTGNALTAVNGQMVDCKVLSPQFINPQLNSLPGGDIPLAVYREIAQRTASIAEHYSRGSNIILMGSPGAGKTTVARAISKVLEKNHIDVDDDVFEPTWQMSVADKLAEIGGEKFLELEAETFLKFSANNSVISLSGSQPINYEVMKYARKLGLILYLDVHNDDILHRLFKMKVNRIVGQEEGLEMSDILQYRRQFYERMYDVRVLCEQQESADSVAKKTVKAVKRFIRDKGYSSTRSVGRKGNFTDVILQGLASDGGLYVGNASLPTLTFGQWDRLVSVSYADLAFKVLEQWISPLDIPRADLRQMTEKAYSQDNFSHEEITPVVPLESNQYLLELFHGPTGSFKDIPLQLTARLFNYAVKKRRIGERSLMLVATSGDTGGAVLDAFTRHTDCCEVVVLFPENGVSLIQKAQLTGFDDPRSCVIGVNKDFDYCQSVVKQLFVDNQFNKKLTTAYKYNLSAANSINYARLLPQVVYHVRAYLSMVQDGHVAMGNPVDVCVPTGNFGNILAAYYAKMMGIPFRRLVIASNVNNVLHDFFTSGVYDISQRSLQTTISPAIDILKSSNLERYIYSVSGGDQQIVKKLFTDLEKERRFSVSGNVKLMQNMQRDFQSGWCTDEESLATVADVFQRTGYIMDPHTAVAKTVADKMGMGQDVPVIISSTAHYSKFSDSILKVVGDVDLSASRPSSHRLVKDINRDRHHKQVCAGHIDELKAMMEEFLGRMK